MKTVKQTAEYTVFQRGDKRYAVRGKDKKWINGDAKVEILVKEGLLEKQQPKAKPEPEPEAAEAPAEESAEPAAEEAPEGESSEESS